jgi:hypothetical protein
MPVVINGTAAVSIAAGNANIGYVHRHPPLTVADIASAAITTSATTSAVTPAAGPSYSIVIPVTTVTGTNPTMDVGVEESDDSGTNWFRVYDFPRITATGCYRSPPIPARGNRVRYVQTIGGTSPSFTRSVNRLQRSDDAPIRVQFIDRAIVPNTLNSTTATYYVEGCKDLQAEVRVTAQTGAATITAEFSRDGTNWFSHATTLVTAVGTVVAKYASENWKFMRLRTSTAGSGITLGEASIVGVGA